MKCGLLPLAQTAMRFADIAYHDYEGVAINLDEQARWCATSASTRGMILRNHGLLVVGASIAEAFNSMFRLERACQVQIAALSCNTEMVAAAARGHRRVVPPVSARRAPAVRRARVAGAAPEARLDRPLVPRLSPGARP